MDTEVVQRRTANIAEQAAQARADAAEARAAAALMRQEASNKRPVRKRQRTTRAMVHISRECSKQDNSSHLQEMDDDPDGDDNGIEAGAVEDPEDINYGSKKTPRKKKTTLSEDEQIEYDNMTPCNLSAEDPPNFLKLSLAIQILIRREIVETDLQRADMLIREYCAELVHVRLLIDELAWGVDG